MMRHPTPYPEVLDYVTDNLEQALVDHEHWGGILLVVGEDLYTTANWFKATKKYNRSPEYLNSLAPEWSEADKDTLPGQLSLI